MGLLQDGLESWLKFGREDEGSRHGRSSPPPNTPQIVGGHGGPHLPPYLRPHLPSTAHLYPPRNMSSSPSKFPSFRPKTTHFSSKTVEALVDSVGVFGWQRWWALTGLEGGPWRWWVSRRGGWTRRPHGLLPPFAQGSYWCLYCPSWFSTELER